MQTYTAHSCQGTRLTNEMSRKQKGETYLVVIDSSCKRPKVQVIRVSARARSDVYVEEMRIRKSRNITAMYFFNIEDVPNVFIVKTSKKYGVNVTKYDVIMDKEKYKCRDPEWKLVHSQHLGVPDGILFAGCGSDVLTKYNVNNNQWSSIQLRASVYSPFLVNHSGQVYVFEGTTLQVLNPLTGIVVSYQLECPVQGLRAFSHQNDIVIQGENDKTIYTPVNHTCKTLPNRGLRANQIHAIHESCGKYYAVVTATNDELQLWDSEDTDTWNMMASFPSSRTDMGMVPAVFIEYPHACPVIPFIDYENQLRKRLYYNGYWN